MEILCDKGPKYWSSDSLLNAKGLLLAITGSEFIASLVVTNGCLGKVRLQGITSSLQAEAKDKVQTVEEIDVVLASLNDVKKRK